MMYGMNGVRITLIAAISRDFGIGCGGKLPWNLPEDLKRFRNRTRGHPVVMGRKTLESIGRALPDRPNFVITRNPGAVVLPAGDIRAVSSLDEALEAARAEALRLGKTEVFVIGGGEIYAQALPHADRLDITEVDVELGGRADAFFPRWEPTEFVEVFCEDHGGMPDHGCGFRFKILDRHTPVEH
jgi:dihydrofolate reductase